MAEIKKKGRCMVDEIGVELSADGLIGFRFHLEHILEELIRDGIVSCDLSCTVALESISRTDSMQNNIDLTREILSKIRAKEDLTGEEIEIEGYDPLLVARHVERLCGDGYIDVEVSYHALGSPARTYIVRDLSSAGHAFLSGLESEDVWNQLKTSLSPKELGRLSLKRLGGIVGDLAEKGIRKKLGLD